MKNTKQCPKCNGVKILFVPGYEGAYGSGNNIPAGFFKSAVKVNRYICGTCGYSEEWINREDIEKIESKYTQY